MKLFIIVFLLAIYYVFSDLIPAYKKRNYKTLWVYLSLMLIAVAINVLLLLKIKIPSISVVIKSFFEIFTKFDY